MENLTVLRNLDRVGIHNRHLTRTRSVDILGFEVYKHIFACGVDAVERNGYIAEHFDSVLDAHGRIKLILSVPLGILLVALNLRKRTTLIYRDNGKVVALWKGQRHHITDKLFVCVVYQRSRPTDAEVGVVLDALRLVLDHIFNLLEALLGLTNIDFYTVLCAVSWRENVVYCTLSTLAEWNIFDVYMLKIGRRRFFYVYLHNWLFGGCAEGRGAPLGVGLLQNTEEHCSVVVL